MTSALIYVVRHGQTDENYNGIIQGQNNTLLNEVGIDQASRIAEAFKGLQFDLIYTSDLRRAYDTASLIGKYHDKVPIRLSQLLRERYMGELQGKPVKTTRSATLEATTESIGAFTKRISDFWDDVLTPEVSRSFREKENQTVNVLIVSHGAFISSMTRYLVQLRGMKDCRPHGNVSSIRFCPNAGVTLYELQDNSTKLLKFGDISYLDISVVSLGNSDEVI